MALNTCENRPLIVADRGRRYPWAWIGIHTLDLRQQEKELKDRTKRFYNNVNAKTVKSIEEIATAIAPIHNPRLNSQEVRGVIPS